MSDTRSARMAKLLHHRSAALAKGDAVSLPIHATSTYHLPGEPDGSHFYSRNGNPTVEAVEAQLGILEDAEVVAFPSGMAAIAGVLLSQLKAGDTALLPSDGYYNSRLLMEELARFGVALRTCATPDMIEVDMDECALVMIETPSNPGLDVCDIEAVAAKAKAVGALVIADNTSATPLLQQPLDMGVDAVMHADTKAISGHSDVLFGHVASRNGALIEQVRTWRKLSGAIVSPFDAFLVHRGLETLDVRLERMCRSALALAKALDDHPAAGNVRYPHLQSDPSYAIASRQLAAGGSVINFTLEDAASADAFIAACPLLANATSFGGVHSSAERRARWGDAVPNGFVRLSVGVEPTEELVSAVMSALDEIG